MNHKKNTKLLSAQLEKRLSQFYHLRGKFNERILYYDINSKIIVNSSETKSFYGPLSTTLYHVGCKNICDWQGYDIRTKQW